MIEIEPIPRTVRKVSVSADAPECPHRMLFVSPTGSGKTTIQLNLFVKAGYREFFGPLVFLFCPSVDEIPLWVERGVPASNCFSGYDEAQLHWILEQQKRHIETTPPERQRHCLLILEDRSADKRSNSPASAFNRMLSNCRHHLISVWCTGQLYRSIARFARIQFDNVVFLRIANLEELNQIARDYSVDLEAFNWFYQTATSRPYGFLWLKLGARGPEFRKAFEREALQCPPTLSSGVTATTNFLPTPSRSTGETSFFKPATSTDSLALSPSSTRPSALTTAAAPSAQEGPSHPDARGEGSTLAVATFATTTRAPDATTRTSSTAQETLRGSVQDSFSPQAQNSEAPSSNHGGQARAL